MPTFRNTVSSILISGVSRKYISEFYMPTFRNTVGSIFIGGVSMKFIYIRI